MSFAKLRNLAEIEEYLDSLGIPRDMPVLTRLKVAIGNSVPGENHKVEVIYEGWRPDANSNDVV
jgi:hypothetical protein